MIQHTIIIVTAALVIAGCGGGGSAYVSTSEDAMAESHMQIADSLTKATSLREAALEYEFVAEEYPTSRQYRTAVRKAAYLHCDPSNRDLDEEAALYWFQIYHEMEISKEEKTNVETYIGLLKRIVVLRTKMTRKTADLEQQVKYTNDELKKLKDVDVKIHERRVKK